MKSSPIQIPAWIVTILALLSASAHAGGPSTGSGARPEASLPRSAEHDYALPEPGSYRLPVIKEAADGRVLDAKRGVASLKDLTRGRITVLSFIYTRCASANACPRATGMLKQLHRLSEQDTALASSLRLVTMSFDPKTDTPERMAAYSAWAGTAKDAAEWRFLTAESDEALLPILRAYDQMVDRRANMDDPLGPYFHPVRVYLIDRAGRIRNIYSFGTLDPRLVATDVRTLLIEESEGGSRTKVAGNRSNE